MKFKIIVLQVFKNLSVSHAKFWFVYVVLNDLVEGRVSSFFHYRCHVLRFANSGRDNREYILCVVLGDLRNICKSEGFVGNSVRSHFEVKITLKTDCYNIWIFSEDVKGVNGIGEVVHKYQCFMLLKSSGN